MNQKEAQPVWRKEALVVLAFVVYVALMVAPFDMAGDQQAIVALLALVAILWLSEVTPLFVTALLIPILLVLTTSTDQKTVFAAFADPIIALFFGSFVIALALAHNGVDLRVSRLLNKLTKGSARGMVFGFLIVAALLGMWISNTATVSLLLPAALLVIKSGKLSTKAPRLTKSILFACAMGAAIGGMATPVGTPPNAIALRYLLDAGHEISFTTWFSFGLPLVAILIPAVWFILTRVLSAEQPRIKLATPKSRAWSAKEIGTLLVLGGTIAAWLTQPLHGITPAVIALLAAAICFAINLLTPASLAKVPYQALILFGGGLALGDAMVRSGLTKTLVDWITSVVQDQPAMLVLAFLMLFAIALTTIASNTASAALLVPIVLSIATQMGIPAVPLVITTTLALSIDFLTPIGTPPAALIHSTGLVHARDFVRVGSLVSITAATIIFIGGSFFLR